MLVFVQAIRRVCLAALLCALPGTVLAQADGSIGVVALVNPDAVLDRSAEEREPIVGDDVFLNDRMVTDGDGQVHLMLVDKSTFTIGPNSEITIDEFVYDPETRAGEMAMSAVRGVMRFVGGDISKQNPVEIQTAVGTLGIRGGIMLLNISEGGGITAVFGYGTALSFSSAGGEVASVVRPGFMVEISPQGAVSPPVPAPPAVLDGLVSALEGGGPTVPAPVAPGGGGNGATDPAAPGSQQPETPQIAGVEGGTTLVLDTDELGISGFIESESQGLLAQIGDDVVPLDQVIEDQILQAQQDNNTVNQVVVTLTFDFSLFDTATNDNDQVSYVLNNLGNQISSGTNLVVNTNAGLNQFSINVDAGAIELIVTALNEGTGAPNTLGVQIDNALTVNGGALQAGVTQNGNNIESDLNQNQTLTLTGTIDANGNVTITNGQEGN